MSTSTKSKKAKSKSTTPSAGILTGLTPAQSRALRLVRKGAKFTVRDVADGLAVVSTKDEAQGTSLSLARAHVRAWRKAGYVTAVTQGSQGVAGIYKRTR